MFDCASFIGFGRHFIQVVQSKMCWRRDLQNLFGSSHYIKRRQVFHRICFKPFLIGWSWIPLTPAVFLIWDSTLFFSWKSWRNLRSFVPRAWKPVAVSYPEMTSQGASKVKIPFKTASRTVCDLILVWTLASKCHGPTRNLLFYLFWQNVNGQVNWTICKRKSRVSDSSLFIDLYIYLYSSSFFLFSFFCPHVDSLQCQIQFLVVRVNQFLNCRILNSSRPWITSLFLRRLSR